jgi:glycosyltransferase involved in cell wall biosynthesis
MGAPLVSVIIPAYNDAAFIGQALRSVLAQSYRPLDIVVVDDGSTDSTVAIVRETCSEARVLQQANAGAAVARNRGLAEARGDYVAFLDADDIWHPRKTELELAHLRSCPTCIATYCRKIELRGDAAAPAWTEAPSAELARVSEDPLESGWLYLELLRNAAIQTSTIMVARGVLDRVGRFDESLRKGQDLEFWLRLSRLGKIHMLDGELSAYRVHGASISHKPMPINYQALVMERSVGMLGPSDPAGNSLRPHELERLLASSWFQFAYQHFRAGSFDLCHEAIRRSLQYRPWRWQPRVLAARAALKSLAASAARSLS